jgi:hypothetical protein
MRMRRIILPSVTSSALAYFSKLSPKRHGFREDVNEHKKPIVIFFTNFVWNFHNHFIVSWSSTCFGRPKHVEDQDTIKVIVKVKVY